MNHRRIYFSYNGEYPLLLCGVTVIRFPFLNRISDLQCFYCLLIKLVWLKPFCQRDSTLRWETTSAQEKKIRLKSGGRGESAID
jgi:hypothetical protein